MKVVEKSFVIASVLASASLLMASGGCSSDCSSGASRSENIRKYCEKFMGAGCDDTKEKTIDDCVARLSKDLGTVEACEQEVDAFFACMASHYSPTCEDDGTGHTVTIDRNVQKTCEPDYDAIDECYKEHKNDSADSADGGPGDRPSAGSIAE